MSSDQDQEKDNQNIKELSNIPPENTMSFSPVSFEEDVISKSLVQAMNISDQVLHEPTCIICSNPYREDIEKEWTSSGKNHAKIKELIKNKSNIDVSNDAIDNHMLYHCNRGIGEIQKGEYIGRIQRLNSVKLTTLDRIDMCLAGLTERLIGINSIVPCGDYSVADIEKIKSAETGKLMSAFNQILKLHATIMGEMKTTGEVITIPKDLFVAFFTDAITHAKSDEEKRIINSILSGLGGLGKST